MPKHFFDAHQVCTVFEQMRGKAMAQNVRTCLAFPADFAKQVLDVVPEGTPTEVVEHRLPEDERICSACGSKLVEIGKEVRRS